MLFNQKKLIFIILLLLSGIIYYFFWNDAPLIAADTIGYIQVAKDISDGHLDEVHFRTIGYPVILLLTDSLEPTKQLYILQILFYLLAVYIVISYLIDNNYSLRLSYIIFFISLLPPYFVHTIYMLTETSTLFFISLGTVYLLRWIKGEKIIFIIISGISFAISAIIRPTFQLLFAILVVGLLLFYLIFKIKATNLKFSFLSISGFSIIVLGIYLSFNYINFNYVGLTPIMGFNLSTKTARVVERLPDKYKDIRDLLIDSRDSSLIQENKSHTAEMYIWKTIPKLKSETNLNLIELSRLMLKANIYLITSAPFEYLIEVWRAGFTYWLPSTTNVSNMNSRIIQLLWSLIHFIIVIIFFVITFIVLFLITMIKMSKKLFTSFINIDPNVKLKIVSLLLILCVIFYNMLISILVEVGYARYRVPTDLLILMSIVMSFDLVKDLKMFLSENIIKK